MTKEIKEAALPFESTLSLHYVGPDLAEGAMPSLFYFCTAAKQTLSVSPFSDILDYLPDNMRVFSLSLPFHKEETNNRHVVKDDWSKAFQEESLFLDHFFSEVDDIFTYLFDSDYLEKGKVAVGGISRGGFVASHIASRHDEIQHLLAFAPMTDLDDCPFFENLPDSAHQYNVSLLANKLHDTSTFFLIGNNDTAVSTQACMEFITSLSQTTGKRSPEVFLKIRPSIGHRGHGTPPEAFEEGALWLKEAFDL